MNNEIIDRKVQLAGAGYHVGLESRRARSLKAARMLSLFIIIGGTIAALGGLALRAPDGYGLGASPGMETGGVIQPYSSLFGRQVALDGQGLYRRDSVSSAAQERAQDLVTLIFAVPLLAMGFAFSGRTGYGGRLMLSGALGYFAYCYGMMSMGTTYNEFFLLYVALFSMSLYGMVLSMYSIDADALEESCHGRYPRRSAIALCIGLALFLGLAWVGRILQAVLAGEGAPVGIDAASTLFVQAFDLGILVPAALISAFWLLKRDRRGYIAASVLLVKGAAEGLAVAAMGFNMLRVGVKESLPMILVFLSLALLALVIGTKAVMSAGFSKLTRV